ncbi:S8 family serine peptidase [Mycolicibacterium brumae]|nr:S8 family serine peptidase [Mycolicibacterium brumae]MCV7192916.1 S8 family serine peptidase [Mycolicibacterium brumae]RWA23505.1 hypothetical protein MBRU_01390 [Mycolicibacterium brumae DSM 44177]UWW08565.1 mycP2 [Mycolicibacterium brumae]
MTGSARRWLRAGLAALLVAAPIPVNSPVAQGIPPPSVDPSAVPAAGEPGPDEPMRQSNRCAQPITVSDPDVGVTAPGFAMLNIATAWEHSTGHGVPVAVIDTGVNPSPRLPVVPGGDYVDGGDGLSDCDSHGSIIASIIAAAPQGMPMPPPMPAAAAFPAPDGQPVTGAEPPPADRPPPPTPKPPPAPVTIIKTEIMPAPAVAPPDPGSPPDAPANAPGDADPGEPEIPAVPAPEPGAADGVAGVAPHAVLISVRQTSRAFTPVEPGAGETDLLRKAGTLATLARAVVRAADLGAKVINLSVTSCMPSADPLDQRALGAALWYAATVKDAVVVAAAGNEGEDGCAQNPPADPTAIADPRGWNGVKTVSSPSWFSDYVLSVAAVDNTGAPLAASLSGPWVSVAAPGVGVMGLSPFTGGPVNALPPSRTGERNMPFWGTSFAAAFVTGVAALVRAKYPELSAHQVINRILQTAHNPPRGVDNQVGYGVVDPVAALTFDVPPGPRAAPGSQTRVIAAPAPPQPADRRAHRFALSFAAVVAAAALALALAGRARRSR